PRAPPGDCPPGDGLVAAGARPPRVRVRRPPPERCPSLLRCPEDPRNVLRAEELRWRRDTRGHADELVHGGLVAVDRSEKVLHVGRWGFEGCQLARELEHRQHLMVPGRLVPRARILEGMTCRAHL